MKVAKPRVFVVLDKRATRTQLERAFRETCEGVDSVDLKKDARGRERGFAYVTFAEPAHAFAAAERLDGAEIPPGSGKRAKVMPAEKPPRRRRGAREERRGEPRLWTLDPRGFGRLLRYRRHRNGEGARRALEDGARDPARGERERDKPSAAALRRPREEEGDEAVSSWQPRPGSTRASSRRARQRRRTTTEVASSLRTRASRLATEDEAGEAAAALGKVSLGTRGKASLAVPGKGGEERDPRWNDRREDKSESFGKKKKSGDSRARLRR